MQLQEHKLVYIPDEEVFSFQDTLLDNISFKVFVVCSKEKFLQYQKDILEEFVANFTNIIKTSEELDAIDIRDIFEQNLQLLNTTLKEFAEKVRDVERFRLKWIIQLVIDDKLMTAMIWDASMMVMRDQKTAYSIQNTINTKSKIDLFSDIIEWTLERDDQIIYMGLKFDDVMDAHDLKEMENLLAQEESPDEILSFIEELFVSRVEKVNIWFIISYFVKWSTINIQKPGRWPKLWWIATWESLQYISDLWNKIKESELLRNVKRQLSENKLWAVWTFLVILILIFVYSLISQIINSQNHVNKFQTSAWVYIDINLDDLQTAISDFKTLDASSDLKTTTYLDISQKLDFLEGQWKWLEDVASLRAQLDDNFYEGFNVRQFKTAAELNSIAWKNTQVFTFNSTDLSKLWTLNSINVPKNNNLMIAWSKWAIIDATSDTSRWTLINTSEQNLKDCIPSLNSNWIYCYNDNGWIYMITKTWIVPVWTEDGDFRSWIGWLWTFSNRNLYVFNSNVSSLWNMLLTRYQINSDWTYANFKKWSSYSVAASWANFWTFSSFAIDGNFFGWANGKLYLFRREDVAWTSLEYRQIYIKWWNPFTDKYSDNVKILTSNSTRYIYVYDKNQQLFTVYNTEKTKMNEDNKRWYQLVYMFSLKFDVEWLQVYDVAIPSITWDRPELYLLTSEWVNKINLYEYIEASN